MGKSSIDAWSLEGNVEGGELWMWSVGGDVGSSQSMARWKVIEVDGERSCLELRRAEAAGVLRVEDDDEETNVEVPEITVGRCWSG